MLVTVNCNFVTYDCTGSGDQNRHIIRLVSFGSFVVISGIQRKVAQTIYLHCHGVKLIILNWARSVFLSREI